ncbi:hypothetical protein [Nocardia cyriacigeorgica]|jgi:hypothetical protein|uniref:hypothetical protein n=1 Tax=Nocardia cyriacigeorgica TaxID=135487 RepID=UPI000CEA58B2|nr:hypothetical protein [Nocardia cyriacigeorgica]AVH22200.1 hypothetical protein C5B73_12845 [Nocardia cyriacigeorgica]MBF6086342.1 hypothetical protein [Nocardia cyriacigeorgica]MBF6091345.1 hypothetical protein [Nocardia cyriacigeorgica]MBF6497041.1 hypothetical protein [Nocardia cyriacigeorgica]PPJ13697.1 hypothetical protein C5E43_08740 [Nocardia cyriacigeorgica]
MPDDPIAVLERWHDSGAIWRVTARRPDSVTVTFYPCTGDEELDHLTSADPDLLRYLADRDSSED